MLSLELADLSGMGADLSILGFTNKELSAALSRMETGLTDENDVPEVGEVAISQPGDIWQLGPHRVACGDSRDESLVRSLLAGTVPQLMVTEPPYGVEYDPEWRHRRGVGRCRRVQPRLTGMVALGSVSTDVSQFRPSKKGRFRTEMARISLLPDSLIGHI
jgi:hypothetical protein